MIKGNITTPYGSEVGGQIFEIMKEAFVQYEYNLAYLELVEERISEKGKEIRKEIEKYIKEELNEELHYDIYDSYKLDIGKYETHNPKLLYESLYTSIYSYFENALREICRAFYIDYNGRIVPEYREGIIGKYYKIISYFGDISSLKNLWKNVTKFQKQRNDIIHNKLGREDVTRKMVLDANTLARDLIYGIWNNITIPETSPDRKIIPPNDKKSLAKKSKKDKVKTIH